MDRHDERQRTTLLPLLREESRLLEAEGGKRQRSAGAAIRVWREEPAQEALAEDADCAVGGATLRKWQDRFRVAMNRWQQHTKKA